MLNIFAADVSGALGHGVGRAACDAQAGEGSVLGMNVLDESLKIKERVGYMTQKFSLYEDLSIRENLDFIAALSQRILIIQKGAITREVAPAELGDASLVGEFVGIAT